MKVFLGGTCNGSTWRDRLIPMLKCEYFNPVVSNWTKECMDEEIKQRKECDICLYVITPKMKGVYSIAEVVDDSNKRPHKTFFILLQQDDGLEFDEDQCKSLFSVLNMVNANGVRVFTNLDSVADTLNTMIKATMIQINGKPFRCECGCNVFTKKSEWVYRCNSCNIEYEGSSERNSRP